MDAIFCSCDLTFMVWCDLDENDLPTFICLKHNSFHISFIRLGHKLCTVLCTTSRAIPGSFCQHLFYWEGTMNGYGSEAVQRMDEPKLMVIYIPEVVFSRKNEPSTSRRKFLNSGMYHPICLWQSVGSNDPQWCHKRHGMIAPGFRWKFLAGEIYSTHENHTSTAIVVFV